MAARRAGPLGLLVALLLASLPGASGHGFAGFEVSGTHGLDPAGAPNSSFALSKHGEPSWRFEISFSASREGGNGTRVAILVQVMHAASVEAEFTGPAGALTVPTEDTLDYWINWSNPTQFRIELRYRVAFIGPPSPIELSAILALGAAVMTLTVVVLAIDGLHSVARRDKAAQQVGYTKASELAKEMEEDAGVPPRSGDPAGRKGERE